MSEYFFFILVIDVLKYQVLPIKRLLSFIKGIVQMSLPVLSIVLLLLSGFFSVGVNAQAVIRDSGLSSETSSVTNVSAPNATAAETSFVYELQALQQEILSLRGQLEQQGYEIKRLKQQRLDDYLDLDKRVSELVRQQSESAVVVLPANPLPSVPVSNDQSEGVVDSLSTEITPSLPNDTEQSNALYDSAINLLLNEQDYDGAQEKFIAYVDQYPRGKYIANVYYWQGQILYAANKKEEAAAIFEKLIAEFSDHSKVPDAKFKLARIYFDQGDAEKAKVIFDDVASSNTDAALLAKSFINKNY